MRKTVLAARAAALAFAALTAACSTLAVAPPPARPPPAVQAPQPPSAETEPRPPVAGPVIQPATRVVPPSDGVVAPPRAQSDATSASGALLEQSRAQRAAGSMPAAKASLERALRLDPNNPDVWLELGEVELQSGNNAQAATMARKALSLAGRNYALAARAQRLLRAAE